MGWLDKMFGNEEAVAASTAVSAAVSAAGSPFAGPEAIRFGRYSDNNKSSQKTESWQVAQDRFNEKAYPEMFAAIFDYFNDEEEQNVVFRPDGRGFTFELVQGSKKIYGKCDGERIVARAQIAVMEKPSTAVMRRMLELNYALFYNRCALDDKNVLCMIFDSEVAMSSPHKLYNGLRELARFADRQDDLLVADFESLKAVETDHIQRLPAAELDVKYTYFRQWVQDTLTSVSELNADSFSGAIAYAFLGLLYRIDFLTIPQARLLADMEVVSNLYWNNKNEIPIVQRNALMKEGIRKLLDITREEFSEGVYRAKGTFASTPLPPPEKIREHVHGANKDALWYIENKHPTLAPLLSEYGMMYNQFLYSMPQLLTGLATIYMAVLHADFFKALGMHPQFADPETKAPDKLLITQAIDAVIAPWTEKYKALNWDHSKINYTTAWDFLYTFSDQVVSLNLEVKK